VLRPEYGDGAVILLDDDLDTLLHLGQNGVEIASHLSFAHVDSRHRVFYSNRSYSSLYLSPVKKEIFFEGQRR
jgi:hypothetical protein